MIVRPTLILSAIALLTAAHPAHASVTDFRLPPGTPTPTPRPQGPVDPENPVTRPSAAPTPSPTPVPTVAPTPRLTLPADTPAAQAPPTRQARPVPRPIPTPAATPAPLAQDTPAETPSTLPTGLPTLATPAPQAAQPTASPENEGDLPWGWIAIAVLGLAAAAVGWRVWRRSSLPRGTVVVVPEIEKPRVPVAPPPVPREPEPAAEPAPPQEPTHPLQISITPIKLTQTFMNETLAYRLTLTNVGRVALGPLAIAADLVGAHASLSREEQIAGPNTALPDNRTVPGIDPGETVEITGDIRTPLAELSVIRQGAAALLVPLARFRVSAQGMEMRHFTLAVGQQVPGANGLSPIRLDLGPRTTDGLAGRAF